jgi:ABC-type multidrug transport system permease subunit
MTNIGFTNMRKPDIDTVGAMQDIAGMVFQITGTDCSAGFVTGVGVVSLIGPFLREHEKRLYHPLLFYLVYTIYHIPVQLIIIAIEMCIYFWSVGITRTWEAFWKYYILFLVGYFAASGFSDILLYGIRNLEMIN